MKALKAVWCMIQSSCRYILILYFTILELIFFEYWKLIKGKKKVVRIKVQFNLQLIIIIISYFFKIKKFFNVIISASVKIIFNESPEFFNKHRKYICTYEPAWCFILFFTVDVGFVNIFSRGSIRFFGRWKKYWRKI